MRLCGEFAIELGAERAERRLRGQQGKLLFAYLLLHRGRSVPQHPQAEAQRDELSAAALGAATRLADPRAVLVALEGRHFALCRPDNLEERIDAAERTIALARDLRDVERDLLGRYFLIADLVEAGQMERADAAIAEYGARAEESRSALHRWYHARFEAMRALLAGRFEDAARRA